MLVSTRLLVLHESRKELWQRCDVHYTSVLHSALMPSEKWSMRELGCQTDRRLLLLATVDRTAAALFSPHILCHCTSFPRSLSLSLSLLLTLCASCTATFLTGRGLHCECAHAHSAATTLEHMIRMDRRR